MLTDVHLQVSRRCVDGSTAVWSVGTEVAGVQLERTVRAHGDALPPAAIEVATGLLLADAARVHAAAAAGEIAIPTGG
jgi:hypothetical protein